jgi:glycosyltransferase XagB
MQDGGMAEAVAGTVRRKRRDLAVDSPSIAPHAACASSPSFPLPNIVPVFPEIDCIRDWLPDGVVAAAERRAGELGIGADRVLIASGLITEEDYAKAMADTCGVAFVPLDETPRAACPLADDRLLDAAAAGLLPLHIGDGLVLVIAPRLIAARRLAGLFAAGSDVAARFCFTSARRLHQFVADHAHDSSARRAIDGLHSLCPGLSASPQPPRWNGITLISIVAIAAGIAILAPKESWDTINVLLAMIFIACIGLRLFGSLIKLPEASEFTRLADDRLPIYSIVVALYREAGSVQNLVASLRQLDYPAEKLDIILVIEPDDVETRVAIERLHLGPPFQTITAPAAGPRTKPKALNAALQFAVGTFTVIYDAEDRPERDQLRRALNMFLANSNLACVQARLTIDNTADSWLARFFTAEYAGHFDVLLPGLAALGLPLPLGGSSNHFRTAVLREVGAWDPYNVTEDADLGIRLRRFAYGSTVIASTTYEEAPACFMPWLRQRTRWFKGWMQTWQVHTRSPRRLLADLGLPGFMTLQLLVGGNVLASLIYPIFLAGVLGNLILEVPAADNWDTALVAGLHGGALVMGFLVAGGISWLGLVRRGLHATAWVLILIPLHWLLLSLAAWRALYQLMCNPYHWEKTEHGLAQTSRLARSHQLRASFPERRRMIARATPQPNLHARREENESASETSRDTAASPRPLLPAAV